MSRPARLGHFDYTGFHRYFLTFCARSRRAVFTDAVAARETLLQFARTASEGRTERANLRRFAKMSKQRAGARHALTGGGKLWQGGYYDRVLRKDEDVKRIARYILENPVRARLVTTPAEYPFLGSDVWSLGELFDAYQ